jgi:hypothetical protein
MRPLGDTVERKLGRLGRSSHGVVTSVELLHAGLSVDEIRRRLRSSALLREYPGVYRVGHRAPSLEARYVAAVRACGERAVPPGGRTAG